MSAAAFVLTINLFIAAIFATAFGVVAAYQKSALGARWLALAYALGILDVTLEFLMPYQADHRLASFGIFSSFLIALACFVVGLAHHYRVRPPYLVLAIVVGLSILVNVYILDQPRAELWRNLVYQAPNALVQGIGVLVLLQSRRRRTLDIALIALMSLSSLHFLAKPFLADAIGSGAIPQAYIGSTYAAISQSLGAVLMIANGLLILLIIVRDVMAEMLAASETDSLSGLLNRRGFEDRVDPARHQAARTGAPAVMLVADLDHFKQINDTYGHEAGDRVIAAFAGLLRDIEAPGAVAARLGGEEFAVFLPGADLMEGKRQAEMIRAAFSTLPIESTGLPTPATASLGVAELLPGERLSELMRRADSALYDAKATGRDRVALAGSMTRRQRPQPVIRRAVS